MAMDMAINMVTENNMVTDMDTDMDMAMKPKTRINKSVVIHAKRLYTLVYSLFFCSNYVIYLLILMTISIFASNPKNNII